MINMSRLVSKNETDEYKRDWLRRFLSSGKAVVVFTKADGSERSMICTTNGGFIPEEKQPKGTGSPSSNENVFRVFDLEKSAWRSFDWTRVYDVFLTYD